MKKVILSITLLAFGPLAGAQEQLTGVFRLSQTPTEVMGEQMAMALDEIAPANEELRWQVFVPENYNPARPPGVFVFIDPRGWGGIPDLWRAVFTDHNLIWIGPNRNETNQSIQKMNLHAILGLRAIEQQYAIDLNRAYVGSSRDAAIVALNAQLANNQFRGAVYMRGSVMWDSLPPDKLEMLQRKRHVFITGTNDENKSRIRSDYAAYQKAGIENVKLIFDTQRIGSLPDPDHMIKAIQFLDGQ